MVVKINKKRFYANILPSVSKFDYIPDCNNRLSYTFDRSIGAQTWEWDFGDGTTFTGQNPGHHIFPGFGTYEVTLRTTNNTCSLYIKEND
jgi:hypothetical protein